MTLIWSCRLGLSTSPVLALIWVLNLPKSYSSWLAPWLIKLASSSWSRSLLLQWPLSVWISSLVLARWFPVLGNSRIVSSLYVVRGEEAQCRLHMLNVRITGIIRLSWVQSLSPSAKFRGIRTWKPWSTPCMSVQHCWVRSYIWPASLLQSWLWAEQNNAYCVTPGLKPLFLWFYTSTHLETWKRCKTADIIRNCLTAYLKLQSRAWRCIKVLESRGNHDILCLTSKLKDINAAFMLIYNDDFIFNASL